MRRIFEVVNDEIERARYKIGHREWEARIRNDRKKYTPFGDAPFTMDRKTRSQLSEADYGKIKQLDHTFTYGHADRMVDIFKTPDLVFDLQPRETKELTLFRKTFEGPHNDRNNALKTSLTALRRADHLERFVDVMLHSSVKFLQNQGENAAKQYALNSAIRAWAAALNNDQTWEKAATAAWQAYNEGLRDPDYEEKYRQAEVEDERRRYELIMEAAEQFYEEMRNTKKEELQTECHLACKELVERRLEAYDPWATSSTSRGQSRGQSGSAKAGRYRVDGGRPRNSRSRRKRGSVGRR